MNDDKGKLENKICMITGASSGIGKETAVFLAREIAQVVIVCRNREKGEMAVEEIKKKSGNKNVHLMIADLSLVNNVRNLAKDFISRFSRLDILINNAGAIFENRIFTSDGIEKTLMVNYLSPFLIIHLLVDILKVSAPSRVINIVSNAHRRINNIDFNNAGGKIKWRPFDAYSHSKLCLVMMSYHLADKIKEDKITINCYDPLFVKTNIARNGPVPLFFRLLFPFFKNPKMVARDLAHLALSSSLDKKTGKYFVGLKEKKSSLCSYNKEMQLRLWNSTMRLLDQFTDLNHMTQKKEELSCKICGHITSSHQPNEIGFVRGNTNRFTGSVFYLWKCSDCESIHSINNVNFRDIYSDYPLHRLKLNIFNHVTMRNLLKRLLNAGLKKNNRILDYGCGNGIFINFLKSKGYKNVEGYDPYVPRFLKSPQDNSFAWVVANDTIEHVPDPRIMIKDCKSKMKIGGFLYIGTADSKGVDMKNLDPDIMRLHQPYHRVIFNQKCLENISTETGLELIKSYSRSYMDTLIPFCNYRFLDELNKALDHNMDLTIEPSSWFVILRKPMLIFYGLFGYFFSSVSEPAVILRKK